MLCGNLLTLFTREITSFLVPVNELRTRDRMCNGNLTRTSWWCAGRGFASGWASAYVVSGVMPCNARSCNHGIIMTPSSEWFTRTRSHGTSRLTRLRFPQQPPLDFHSEFRGHVFGLSLGAGQRAEMTVCGNRISATDSWDWGWVCKTPNYLFTLTELFTSSL